TPKPQKPGKTPTVDTPGDKGEAILSDPAKILEEAPEEKGILKDLAESQILKDTGETQTAKLDQSAQQALTGHSVTLSTIMPVAYNPTDIRVLSFSVEIQLSNAQSAKMMRESMPVYEKIMNQTVEELLRRKFYNDILYVKEKLQKRLQTAMTKSVKNGRVRKAKFTDFAIQ
ncbi:MAG TPA: flagellar basal body-associated FliL family protein, partial [Desulfobacteria bacterium]|nr:flagellar basal body-associated FliL family protein [Desulfobacteria bacterium]